MRTLTAVGGALALAAGGVLAIGLIAGATAVADDNCPAATAPPAAAQALRAANPAIPPAIGTGTVCQPATGSVRAGGGDGTAGGADASFDP
ncbi:MAG TPA: hypothetical protein VIC62_22215, partial [Nakamurella sp.]